MKIAESVTKYHPDKICDIISDAILDACLKQDPDSRVAVETAGGHGKITLYGEITTEANVGYVMTAYNTYKKLTGKHIDVECNIESQSPEIKAKVDTGGAGDQGLMIGYACRDNELFIPQEMYLARKLLEGFDVDGKSQVILDDDGDIVNAVLSVQGKTSEELRNHAWDVLKGYSDKKFDIFANNGGSFDIGGFDADSGVTGRKIVVDAYGGRVPVGGGAFSGKDPSKVDRSAAYMARWVALQVLELWGGADSVLVKLGYVIGKKEPLIQEVILDGRRGELDINSLKVDCSPQAIIERFDLKKPIYKDLAENGHFGRPELPWEKVVKL